MGRKRTPSGKTGASFPKKGSGPNVLAERNRGVLGAVFGVVTTPMDWR
jgi:hypothetical protein